jgi:hypothetical protein
MDIAGGYKTIEEVGLELGTKATTSLISGTINAVTFGVGEAAEGVTGGAKIFAEKGISGLIQNKLGEGLGNVIAQAALAGVQTLTTSVITSPINAIQWDKETGKAIWSRDAFDAGLQGGLQGAAVGMTASLTKGLLGQVGLFDGKGKPIEEHTKFVYETKQFNNVIGDLAGQGVNYAMGGDFTLNIVNLGDFTNNKANMGLFEVHFGGEEIFRGMKIGTEGANFNYNTLKYAVQGARNFSNVVEAKLNSLIGLQERISVLNGINTMAYSDVKEERDFAEQMIGRDFKSVYEDIINKGVIEKDKIESILGNNDSNSKNMVTVLAAMMNERTAVLEAVPQTKAVEQPGENSQTPVARTVEGSAEVAQDFFGNPGEMNNIPNAIGKVVEIFINNGEFKDRAKAILENVKSGLRYLGDEYYYGYSVVLAQPSGVYAGMDNAFPLWNNSQEKEKDTPYTLANGIEFNSLMDVEVPLLTGGNFRMNNLNISMAGLTEGFNVQANYSIARENMNLDIFGRVNYSWSNVVKVNAGMFLSAPLGGGALEMFGDVEINSNGKSSYKSGVTWRISF